MRYPRCIKQADPGNGLKHLYRFQVLVFYQFYTLSATLGMEATALYRLCNIPRYSEAIFATQQDANAQCSCIDSGSIIPRSQQEIHVGPVHHMLTTYFLYVVMPSHIVNTQLTAGCLYTFWRNQFCWRILSQKHLEHQTLAVTMYVTCLAEQRSF